MSGNLVVKLGGLGVGGSGGQRTILGSCYSSFSPQHYSSSLPCTRSQKYTSMQRGSLPVYLCQAQIWVRVLLSWHLWFFRQQRSQDKSLTAWRTLFVVALKYGHFTPFTCLRVVWTQDRVGFKLSTYKLNHHLLLLFLLFSTIVHSRQWSVPLQSEAPVSAAVDKEGWPPAVFHDAGLLRG